MSGPGMNETEIRHRIDELRRSKGIKDAYDARNWMPEIKTYQKTRNGSTTKKEIGLQ